MGPTYQAQRYSVDFVGSLRHEVAFICACTAEPYDVVLPNGVRAIGAGFGEDFDRREIVPLVAETGPERLILTSPMVPVLRWAHRNGIRTLATLADSFQSNGLKRKIQNRWLARDLGRTEWVGNHNLPACRSLLGIGVDPAKIIPWDWPPSHRPHDYPPRTLSNGKFRLVYVGSVCEAKGVGDLLEAVRGLDVELTIYGSGELNGQPYSNLISNEDVPHAMREADCVVIPSRHEYPEGLPLTIYEALASRTPIIASDHPMFRTALRHEQSALIFPADDAPALRSAICRLSSDPQLYSRLSANSLETWERIQVRVKWGELIERWLVDDTEWLENQTLERQSGFRAKISDQRRVIRVR